MAKDYPERRTYRKSPGRQYESDYDPLRPQSRSGSSQSGRLGTPGGEGWPTYEESPSRTSSRSGLQLAQRPDPRRTRQLLRQSIIASKSKVLGPEEEDGLPEESFLPPPTRRQMPSSDENPERDSTLYSNRYPARSNRLAQSSPAPSQQLSAADQSLGNESQEGWDEVDFVDPDLGDDDPLDRRVKPAAPLARRTSAPAEPRVTRRFERPEEDYDEDESSSRSGRKRGLSRRAVLTGIGVAAIGGTAVAAYELVPKIPQAIANLGVGIEHQLEGAYNAGADAVRTEFVNGLKTLEGVSLEGAQEAAQLTRVGYDVFVSPIVTFLSTIADDFLGVTLQALKSARGFLSSVGQDNNTLLSLQKVLEFWVAQVHDFPKRLQAVTDTDLSGAQAYLRGLKLMLDQQQKLITPTPAPKPKSTPAAQPTHPTIPGPTITP